MLANRSEKYSKTDGQIRSYTRLQCETNMNHPPRFGATIFSEVLCMGCQSVQIAEINMNEEELKKVYAQLGTAIANIEKIKAVELITQISE